jgi:glutathione S-transferase
MRRRRSSQPRLITLAISPFNEFGRWSLDSCGIDYEERRYAIGLHAVACRLARGAGTTPTLLAAGLVLSESTTIAEWADAEARRRGADRGIYPADAAKREQAERLVGHLTADLGPPARRLPWEYLVKDSKFTAGYWSAGLSGWQARLQPWLLRTGRRPIAGAIDLSQGALAAAPGQIEAAFDLVAGMLGDGRPFLLGDQFGVADICFAAMASPALCPPDGYPVPHPQPEEFPHEIAERIRGFRAHPAGEYALRMYREHRQP